MSSALKKAITRLRMKSVKSGVSGGAVGMIDARRNGWYRVDKSQLADGFPVGSQDILIDVGCGDGGIAKFAAEMGAQVIATDIDPQAVARTEKTLKRSGATDYRVEMSDSNPLPVADAACTRIVCLEVLEHVDSPQQLMSELVRVAKPGALFLLAVPDERSEAIQQTLAPPAYWAKPNHVRIFSQADFGGLVEQAGLVIEDRQFKSFFWAMWWTLFWAANQEFGEREQPVLYHWSQTWNELLKSKGGDQIAQKLDGLMPKSQVIIARKPA